MPLSTPPGYRPHLKKEAIYSNSPTKMPSLCNVLIIIHIMGVDDMYIIFCGFLTFSTKKMAIFLKTNVMIQFV
jgi:hypothetical protein